MFRVLTSDTEEAKALISRSCTANDHAVADARRSPQAKRNTLLARALLREMLAQGTGRTDWVFSADENGKPQAHTADGLTQQISLSHSGYWVAVALSDVHPVGIDIEWHRQRNFEALASFAYGPTEQAEVARAGLPAFYRIWTVREAMAKAMGDGVMAQMTGRDIMPADRWELHCEATAEYSLALAVLTA